MNFDKLQKQLFKQFGSKVQVSQDEYSRILTGSLDKWADIVACGMLAVDETKQKYVVNDIVLEGVEIPKMRVPKLKDSALDGTRVDVLVIGGGISGTSILRELTKFNLSALLVEKESDLAMQATGRNDGQVHVGVDLKTSTEKFKYLVKANPMFEQLCKDLDVDFQRRTQTVALKGNIPFLKTLGKAFALSRRKTHNLKDTAIIDGKALYTAEPEIAKQHEFALINTHSGSVCPYNLAIAYGENAVENGAGVSLNTAVLSMQVENGKILSVETNRGTIYPKIVINSAGTFADEVAKMAEDRFYSIHPRKGTNSILDKKAGYIVKGISSVKILQKDNSHSKGGGLVKTVHDNVLVGPNAEETYLREDFSTHKGSIAEVFDKQRITNKNLHERDIITYFTGVRAPVYEEDYIICKGKRTQNLIHCAGIQSPGLTTAPVIAIEIADMAAEMLSSTKNENFNPVRKAPPKLSDMDEETRNEYIKKNSDYGIIICRCEEISKGEILDALNSPIPVTTIDGVKKRVRPGMGRCQGGFCAPLVANIIAEHQNCDISEVKKTDADSIITFGSTKEVLK